MDVNIFYVLRVCKFDITHTVHVSKINIFPTNAHKQCTSFAFVGKCIDCRNMHGMSNIQCVQKVAVHLGYGTQIWLSASKLPLKCAVVSLYSVVKQLLKCNTGKVCNC
jgi:hypothetical protein